MKGTIRAFLAVELPDEVLAVAGELANALAAVGLQGVRPVRPEGIHLTLKFLGEIDTDSGGLISDAVLRVAARHGDAILELGEVGAFPNYNRPRILWVGLVGDTGPLLHLQKDIDESLVRLGFDREERPFSPHLTLARIRDGTSDIDRQRAVETLRATSLKRDVRMTVRSISLIRSVLHPRGAEYERLASFPLGPPPGVGR